MMGSTKVQVRCYSGHRYGERPQAFFWQGQEVAVEEVLAEWREPAGPAFRVRTGQGGFVLAYEERGDRWWLREG
jgi:hypothetical protein